MKLTVNKFFSEETLLTSIIYLRSIWKKYKVSLFLTFCLLTGCFGNESWVKTSRSKCLVKLNAWTVQVLIRSFSKLSGSAVPGSVAENFLLVIGWLCYMSFSCKKQEDNSSCMLSVVMCLVIDRAPGVRKGPTVKTNVRNRKVNLMFPKPCECTKWSRLASFLSLVHNKIVVKLFVWIGTLLWIADAGTWHYRKRFCFRIVLFSFFFCSTTQWHY